MFNLGLGGLSVLALLVLVFKLPSVMPAETRPRRKSAPRPTQSPLTALDWGLLAALLALSFAVVALVLSPR
jgi:hypothetical protein